MEYNFKDLHVVSVLTFAVLQMFIIFSTDNPLILFSIFVFCVSIFIQTRSKDKLRRGVLYFFPFAVVTIIINFLFVSRGSIILFTFFNRDFTLEALVYALIFSIKLLLIIYEFFIIEIIVDSDGAVSYFSSILPKSTLLLMVAFKLFPTLKKRMASLKQVYSLRGVNFDKKSIKEQVKSYSPILAILLETSMEGAFDIGEAAYVRGFLSGKRTVYERQKFSKRDYVLVLHMLVLMLVFAFVKIKNLDSFDIYNAFSLRLIVNYGVIIQIAAILALILVFYLNWKDKEI